jgi:enterochelin esterase-like enzyme
MARSVDSSAVFDALPVRDPRRSSSGPDSTSTSDAAVVHVDEPDRPDAAEATAPATPPDTTTAAAAAEGPTTALITIADTAIVAPPTDVAASNDTAVAPLRPIAAVTIASPGATAATGPTAVVMTTATFPVARRHWRPRVRLHRVHLPRPRALRPLLAIAIALGIGAGLARIGWVAESSGTLQEMGFDPDRARLIASLVGAFVAAVAAAFLTGSRVGPVLAAGGVLAGLFGKTFLRETRTAVESSGASGIFNPVGWTMTVITLGAAALAVGLVAVMVARPVRAWLLETGSFEMSAARTRDHLTAAFTRPVAILLVIALVVVSVPVFADMMNFSPDARMRQGAADGTALFGGPSTTDGGPGASTGLPPSVDGLITAPVGGALVTPATVSLSRPWLVSKPGGAGRLEIDHLPAMWTGGTSTTAEVAVYLPPGYDSSGQRYPVIYEMPWPLSTWDGAIQITSTFDALIDAGNLPPAIVVFVSNRGGPFPDSECVDSYDGRELFDTYVTKAVVPWVDQQFRTIATPDARTIFGFSVGGFCAPSMALRHPDLFRQAVAFDGYFVAAPTDVQTINAWRPFGNDQKLIAAASPLNLASEVAPDQRDKMFVVLSGDPSSRFYGPQMQVFAAELDRVDMPFAWVPSDKGHAWAAVRQTIAPALELAALRQAQLGVFGP